MQPAAAALCLLCLLGPGAGARGQGQEAVLLVDEGSAQAVQRAREAVAGPPPRDPAGPFMLGTFHSGGVAEPRPLGGWGALQEAVRGLQPRGPGQGPRGPLGALDAVLSAAGAVQPGARILVLTGAPAEGQDAAPDTTSRAAAALSGSRVTVDAWAAGACERYTALRAVTGATGGRLCCGRCQVAGLEVREEGGQPAGAARNASYQELGEAVEARGDAELLEQPHAHKGDIHARSAATLTKADGILLLQPAVTIEMARQSQLNVQPGQTVTLTFELTNNRLTPLRFQFRLKDERAYLRSLRPVEALVMPNQPLQIEGTLFIPPSTTDGQSDKVTLIAHSPFEETKKSALISIGQQFINDNANPTVAWIWKHRCVGAWDQATCNTNTWTIEFIVQDRDSGILSIVTVPKGIQFRDDFVSGTRDPVRAYYSASCCAKRVDLLATDVRGNTVRDTFDVGSQFLDDGEKAAIALAVLCFLLIIAVIVMAILLCRRRDSLRLESRLRSRD